MSEDRRATKKTAKRRDEALKRALNTPPKPHKSDSQESKSRYKKGRRPEGSDRRLPTKD